MLRTDLVIAPVIRRTVVRSGFTFVDVRANICVDVELEARRAEERPSCGRRCVVIEVVRVHSVVLRQILVVHADKIVFRSSAGLSLRFAIMVAYGTLVDQFSLCNPNHVVSNRVC